MGLTRPGNVIVTGMISIRLLMMQRRVRAVLSPAHTRTYTGVIAILVESALPFTLLSIGYLATYALNNPVSLAFVSIWGCFCVCFPYLCDACWYLIHPRQLEFVPVSYNLACRNGLGLVSGHRFLRHGCNFYHTSIWRSYQWER